MKNLLILFSFLISSMTGLAQHGNFTDIRLINGDSVLAGSVNGRLFYSQVSNKLRFYQNGTWNSFVKLEGSYTNPSWLVSIPSTKITSFLTPAQGGTGVANNASSTLTISGNFATTLTVSASTALTLPTSGTIATKPTDNRQTASYQLVLTDANNLVEMNVGSANNLTIPANATVAFTVTPPTYVTITQYGAGLTSIVAAGGVTIRSSSGVLTSPGQYSPMVLKKIGTDEWYLWNGSPSVTPAALSTSNDTNVTGTLSGSPNTSLLQATTFTLGWTGQLSGTRGGSGISNAGNFTWGASNITTLANSATLDFGSTAAGASTDLTITVTGATAGSTVFVGSPNGSVTANGVFWGWVSATNTVTVRYTNTNLVSAADPASGTFSVRVFQ